MTESLQIRFDDEGDGTGKLTARISSRGFAGIGSAWFSVERLVDFARGLAAFPLGQPPRMIAGGFYSKEHPGELEEELVGIEVYAVGSRGQIGVQVRLASEVWAHDRPEGQRMVRAELLTTYDRLGRFSRELLAVFEGTLPEATLEREELVK